MSMNPYLSVIIPVHNEAKRLRNCLDNTIRYLHSRGYPYEIIPVDNGSTDETWEILETYLPYAHYFPIHMTERGKGKAVQTGMLYAHGHYRLMMDCDLSTPLCEIDKFLKLMPENDIVIGSREMDRSIVRTSLKRRVIGRVFHSLITDLVPDVRDTQCGFKMFRDWCALDLFNRQKVTGMAFDVELLWLARMFRYSVKEIPVAWKNDPDSRVRLFGDSFQMLWDVINIPEKHISVKIPTT